MLYLLLAMAHAHESNPKTIHTQDTIEVFDNVEIDSGWQPSSGTLGVRLFAGAIGGAHVDMLGESNLRWPDDLTLTMNSEAEAGVLILDFELAITIGLRFDIGAYSWEGDVPVSSIPFYKEVRFDPYLLGQNVEVSDDSGGNTLVDYNVSPFSLVDLVFSGVLTPNVSMNFSGNRWEFQDQQLLVVDDEAYWPPMGEPALDVEGQYFGDLRTDLSLEFSPVMSVCVPVLGCYDLELFSFPVSTFEDDRTHAFPVNPIHFELPQIGEIESSHDFGENIVGDLNNWPMSIPNDGELYLDMSVAIIGDTDHFTVWPEGVYSPANSEDGLLVTYHPLAEGSHSATLILTSNDPYRPVIEIPLSGSAVAVDDAIADDSDTNSEDIDGESKIVDQECGCSSSGKAPRLLWLLGVFAFIRRRR